MLSDRVVQQIPVWLRAHLPLVLLVTTVTSLACQWPEIDRVPLYVAANVIVTLSLVAVGIFITKEHDKRVLGLTTIVIGLSWSYQWVGTWNFGLFPLISIQFNSLLYFIGIYALITYPKDCPLILRERIALLTSLVMPLTGLVMPVVSEPEWNGFRSDAWWPSWFSDVGLFHTAFNVFFYAQAALALGFFIVLYARSRRLKEIDRGIIRPLTLGYAGFGVASALTQSSQLYPSAEIFEYYFILSIVLFMLPISVFGTQIVRRVRDGSVAEELSQYLASEPPTVEAVRDALRKTLHDPELEVFYWSPEVSTYVDSEGQVVSIPSNPSLLVREVLTRDQQPLAMIVTDSSIERHPRVFETAVNAGSVALENAGLQAIVRSQLEEVKASRVRIAEAAMVERNRIERDFHDGVQQRLLGLLARLGTVKRQLNDEHSVASVSSISSDLKSTLNLLRDLTHGISPPELRQFGLKSAVEVMTEGIPLNVKLNIEDVRYTEIVESTAYFVVCEAFANVMKHACAESVEISVLKIENDLEITIIDDGVGGIDENGSGLKGLVDRVSSLRGSMTVGSGLERGSSVKVVIPC